MWKYLVDLNQLEPVLDVDLSLCAFLLNELIGLIQVAAEGVVGIDDGELAVVPGQLAVEVVPVPDVLREEKVVTLDLTVEGCRWNVYVGITSTEVVVPPIGLADGSLPGGMILGNKEGMIGIHPSLLESLDGFPIILLPHGQHQIVILDFPAVAQLHLVFLGEELLHSHSLRVGVEHANGHLGERGVLTLGGSTSVISPTFLARRCFA